MRLLIATTAVWLVACTAPSPADLVVPQDGLHVSGAVQTFFAASPAGTCSVTSSITSKPAYLVYSALPNKNGDSFGIQILTYNGPGGYPIAKQTQTVQQTPNPSATFYVASSFGVWVADGGSVSVISAGTGAGSVIRGTVNVPKASLVKGRTSATPLTATISGAWACTLVATPSPIPLAGGG